MSWGREYFCLKTAVGEAIALVTWMRPVADFCGYNFTLWFPEHKETPREFVPVTAYSMTPEEYLSHRDAFETFEEVEIVKEVYNSTSLICDILVKKKDDPNAREISEPSSKAR